MTIGEEAIGDLERRFGYRRSKIPTYGAASGSAKAKNMIMIHDIESNESAHQK